VRLKADFKLAHWHKVAPQYYGQTYVNSLIVFNGKIYAGTYMSALLFEWNGKDSWVLKAPPLGSPHESEICSLVAFNEKIYGGTAQHARLYEWNGVNAWVEKAGQFGDETYISSLVVYNGKIYGGTAPHGKLLEWNGVNAWVEKAGQFGGSRTSPPCWYTTGSSMVEVLELAGFSSGMELTHGLSALRNQGMP